MTDVSVADWLSMRAQVVERGVDVACTLRAGEVLAVLGPNGAGKSTVLAALAGLVRPDLGHVRVGETVLFDSEAGVDVPVAERRVGLLAQDALLFDSLTVLENVEFGPRSQGRGTAESKRLAAHWLAEVGLSELAKRKPRKLSGGQAQRIAIARALAAEPRVLLLDEPLASLDVTVAAEVRSMLRRVLRERAAAVDGQTATVIVTHDLIDALTLADRVLVVENGVVVDFGPVDRVLREPRSIFTADLAGTNMTEGTALAAAQAGIATLVTADGAQIQGECLHELGSGERCVAVFSPRAVAVYRRATEGSPRNMFPVRVTGLEARGETIRIRGAHGPELPLMAEVTVAAARELGLVVGDAVQFVVKATEVQIYPQSG
nr:ATP-binding cassette domain-containing protein [Tomitella biformata]